MGSDMVVALSRATVEGQALFGHNSGRPTEEPQSFVRVPGRAFALGETVRAQYLSLPQARQTITVIASRSGAQWGYQNGVNAHGVAVARTPLLTQMSADHPGLTGPDLVRLMLERSGSARQAVDLATDLMGRYGQGSFPLRLIRPDAGTSREMTEQDSCFLIADAQEGYVLATCGIHWAVQEVSALRALNEVCQIRQDWDRISPGLSSLAIDRGWWPQDGSKLDFEGTVCVTTPDRAASLRRWGRATLLLEQQHGHLDLGFVRRLLSDHFEGCEDEIDPWCSSARGRSLCQHPLDRESPATAVSLLAQLDGRSEHLRPIWCAFGPPCTSVYFPLFIEGEVPAAFQHEDGTAGSIWQQMRLLGQLAGSDRAQWVTVREALAGLQGRFEQDSREVQDEAALLVQQGGRGELQRLTSPFMQLNVERFEDLCRSLLHDARQPLRRPSAVRAQERFSQTTEL